MITFNGFDKDIFLFLSELERNNNKEWFDEHRKRYVDNVREPLKSFANYMNEIFLAEQMPYFGDSRKSLFRINRDIRFSANKNPYKTNLGAFFPYTEIAAFGKPVESIGLYLHIENDSCFIAGGIHMPLPPILKNIREHISEELEEFELLLNDEYLSSEFPQKLIGEKLKRVPRGFDKDDPSAEYIKNKEFTFLCPVDQELICSDNLIDTLITKGKALMPIHKFLNEQPE